MRKIVFILIAIVSINTFAQKERSHKNSDLTPEQMATLRTKQMTLDLDLNTKQQEQILAINLKNAEEFGKMRGKRKELSDDEKYELKSKMLDKQIAIKKEMKNILNDTQYEKWQKMQKSRMHKMKKKKGEHHKNQKEAKEKEKH